MTWRENVGPGHPRRILEHEARAVGTGGVGEGKKVYRQVGGEEEEGDVLCILLYILSDQGLRATDECLTVDGKPTEGQWQG